VETRHVDVGAARLEKTFRPARLQAGDDALEVEPRERLEHHRGIREVPPHAGKRLPGLGIPEVNGTP
jgi:hypothetical protein